MRHKALNTISLKIADVVVTFQSAFAQEKSPDERFQRFFYRGPRRPDILIDVRVVAELPKPKKGVTRYVTYHPDNQEENWRILETRDRYIYSCPIEEKRQVAFINKAFSRVTAYLVVKEDKGSCWNVTDLIYDFLQILLISYLAHRKAGLMMHAVGIRDENTMRLLFAGRSGCGKSTMARLWFYNTKAKVLNDDRVIMRFIKGKCRIFGSPWHGDFRDYLKTRGESAALESLFFIHHSRKNHVRPVPRAFVVRSLYPSIIPVFFSPGLTRNFAFLCEKTAFQLPCFGLGFRKGKKVIRFVREFHGKVC